MKKRYIIISIIFFFIIILSINFRCYGADLDEIIDYEVTVDPRMNDGSLDITYRIKWKVLDSTTEGPLEWVKIGTPNSYFENPTAITKNIKSITSYDGAYVKIVFNKAYKAGEEVDFKYSIHQYNLYKKGISIVKYSFTPAWFTDIKVDNMIIRWNSTDVKKSNTKNTEDNYLVWSKQNLSKGEKMTATVKYDKDAFGSLQKYTMYNDSYGGIYNSQIWVWIIVFFIIILFISCLGGGGGYYGHRGFYGGYGPRYYGGGCVHHSSCVSSCACAHSSCASSCACACAGSGRAGCSKKDFYGTNLTTNKLKKVMEK